MFGPFVIRAFIAGLIAGVVRERTYQAVGKKMGAGDAIKHVGAGLLTEPTYAYRAVRGLFISEPPPKAVEAAKGVRMNLETVRSRSRGETSIPLEE